MKRLSFSVMITAAFAAMSFGQSVAYSFGEKRFDPIVSASVFPVRKTPFGDLDGLVFAGYRKDGDGQSDTVPIGLGLARSFPFGPNLSFQVGGHVMTAKGSPIDGGFLIGLAYRPTSDPDALFHFGPTMRGGASLSYRVKF